MTAPTSGLVCAYRYDPGTFEISDAAGRCYGWATDMDITAATEATDG